MTNTMHLAQVVEDDSATQRLLSMLLESDGFRVVVSETCLRGKLDATVRPPDVLIIDLGLPDHDGIQLIKSIRTWSPVPILVLSARTAEEQRLAAFDAGADDYILKPYSASELLARVRAALRRHARGESPTGIVELGGVTIDLSRRTVRRDDGRELRLTPLEHRILETLARDRDRVVTQAKIMKEVWGPKLVNSRVLRVFIAGLRKKLERDPARPAHILTEPGVGYRLCLDPRPFAGVVAGEGDEFPQAAEPPVSYEEPRNP
jgi:two-component system, OmpR family, KDP operon response regulator KdpE